VKKIRNMVSVHGVSVHGVSVHGVSVHRVSVHGVSVQGVGDSSANIFRQTFCCSVIDGNFQFKHVPAAKKRYRYDVQAG